MTAEETQAKARADKPHIGVLELGLVFLRIGAIAFGGILSALVIVERELIERRKILIKDDVDQAIVYTRLLPGSGGPLIASYLGYAAGGWLHSAVATAAFLLPGVLLMLGLAIGFVGLSALPAVAPAITGLLAAVVGIQAVATWRFVMSSVKGVLTGALLALAVLGGLVINLNPAVAATSAGLVGALLLAPPDEEEVSGPS